MVTTLAMAAIFGAAATVAADPPMELSAGAKRELKTLEGRWRAVKFLHADRETVHDPNDDPFIFTVTGRRIDFSGVVTVTVADLDPTTDPKCLDFKVWQGSGVLRSGSTYESVYKLDGDTLTWAFYHGRGKNRPPGLEKPTDPAVMVLVLTRLKE